jgi:hypothetical protein
MSCFCYHECVKCEELLDFFNSSSILPEIDRYQLKSDISRNMEFLSVRVIEAQGVPAITSSQSSNPYCALSLLGSRDTYLTRVLETGSDVRWNEECRLGQANPTSSILKVVLCHKDGILDDEMARVMIPLEELPLDAVIDRFFPLDPVPGFSPGAQIRLMLCFDNPRTRFQTDKHDLPVVIPPDDHHPHPQVLRVSRPDSPLRNTGSAPNIVKPRPGSSGRSSPRTIQRNDGKGWKRRG